MKPRNTARGGVQGGCPCGGGTEPRTCPQRSCRISAHEGPWVSGLVGREGLEPCFGAAFTQPKVPSGLLLHEPKSRSSCSHPKFCLGVSSTQRLKYFFFVFLNIIIISVHIDAVDYSALSEPTPYFFIFMIVRGGEVCYHPHFTDELELREVKSPAPSHTAYEWWIQTQVCPVHSLGSLDSDMGLLLGASKCPLCFSGQKNKPLPAHAGSPESPTALRVHFLILSNALHAF
ncbi:uncharacterized protein LOC119521955 isoform X1 [Choloepus didactylus]|uniref:uncharacterized protein LOC119521955 isoform X1 n=1 Tax=Choloepus didactylus TaxID=27675 RepID=UPI00189D82F7|nr:uncharacterized protein LOC119521955 isoform X1 [Choloepus didactylus]